MESEAKAMRKIKWGVMGTAFICERSTFPGMLQAENCEMYAIAGRNMEKAERFKETYGFQKAYGSYEKLLADPKVEAVYIPLPNTMHYEWTIRALKSGKHVLCEKPLAPTEAQAEEMFKAFDKVPNALWEDEYDKYNLVLNRYRDIKVMRWSSNN